MKTASAEIELTKEVDPNWKIGIIKSSFYKEEINHLADAAKKTLISSGINPSSISFHEAAGSFEVPLIGAALAEEKSCDALIGFGIIVEGETHHGELLAEQASRGMMDVQTKYRIPFSFEILYVKNLDQARERSRGPNSKGIEAANAVLHSLAQLSSIQS